MTDFRIHKIDLGQEPQRRAVLEYLAPSETHSLFLMANLANRFSDSHLYVAADAQRWLGIAGYYGGPKALIPFATDPQVVRALVRHIARVHAPIEWMNGIGYAAWPAYQQLLEMGFKAQEDPRHVFMELELPPGPLPCWPNEEKVRPMRPEDAPQIARLMRLLRQSSNDAAVSQEELARVQMLPQRLVLEEEGVIAATASTNGLGLRAFQVLGVASDPRYQRRGFARAICSALIRRMQKQGARHVVLFARIGNTAALRCYAGMGFRETGEYCVAKLTPP